MERVQAISGIVKTQFANIQPAPSCCITVGRRYENTLILCSKDVNLVTLLAFSLSTFAGEVIRGSKGVLQRSRRVSIFLVIPVDPAWF